MSALEDTDSKVAKSCCGRSPFSKTSLRRGSRSEIRRTQRSPVWGKLGKEHPKQKDQQVPQPRDREGEEARELEQGEEEGWTRELQLEREVGATAGMASRGQDVPGSYSESTLLLLFL